MNTNIERKIERKIKRKSEKGRKRDKESMIRMLKYSAGVSQCSLGRVTDKHSIW